MQRYDFGKTGLSTTKIGIGLAALGRPAYINLNHADDLQQNYDVEAMRQHAQIVLDAAYAAGIRYFDAARSYGKSEEFLQAWLETRNIQPNDVTVGSKWGYTYVADWQIEADVHEVKEHSLPVLQRQWGETQMNIGAYLDLYQVHSATLSSGILENTDVLTELARLKSEGTVIGLSLSGTGQGETLAKALNVTVDGVRVFDSVQATWNLLERSAGEMLRQAHEAGMGVIIKEALANGRLTQGNNRSQFVEQRALLETQAQRLNTTIDALVLAGVATQEWVDVVLSGAANVAHLESNVKALEVAWDEEAETALQVLTEDPAAYWHTRSNLDWN